jgi:hypothetical protein
VQPLEAPRREHARVPQQRRRGLDVALDVLVAALGPELGLGALRLALEPLLQPLLKVKLGLARTLGLDALPLVRKLLRVAAEEGLGRGGRV